MSGHDELETTSAEPTPDVDPSRRPAASGVPADGSTPAGGSGAGDGAEAAELAYLADGSDIHDSTPNSSGPQGAAGGMGVSSERVGPTGAGQVATDGVNPVDPTQHDTGPIEARPGYEEERTESALPRKSSWPSADPRSKGEQPKQPPPRGTMRGADKD